MENNSSAFLAGIAISICAFCYSTLSGAMAGAFVFSFGLIAIILYGWKIYTGSAGFIKEPSEVVGLYSILFFNALGCFITAWLLSVCGNDNTNEFIAKAVDVRSVKSYGDIVVILIKGVFCGFIMTTAVKFARKGIKHGFQYFLPLILGVPIFLLSGFYHSIVDAFYLSYAIINELITSTEIICAAITGWLMVVMGNFIGCNITRIVKLDLEA